MNHWMLVPAPEFVIQALVWGWNQGFTFLVNSHKMRTLCSRKQTLRTAALDAVAHIFPKSLLPFLLRSRHLL